MFVFGKPSVFLKSDMCLWQIRTILYFLPGNRKNLLISLLARKGLKKDLSFHHKWNLYSTAKISSGKFDFLCQNYEIRRLKVKSWPFYAFLL